ncbi:MAG: hypothetical protein RMJ13_05935, partial [Elusimicrobiota bacterium]|nr:hypothetical protein [Elusimicrobiota bacterium]
MKGKRVITKGIAIMIVTFLFSVMLFSAAPNKIKYQGRLRYQGQPVSGTRQMEFRIYNQAGQMLWTSGSMNVSISTGIYVVDLEPSTTTINWAEGQYYLEVVVEGNALTPREEFVSVPYAFECNTINGRTYEAFVSTWPVNQTISGVKTFINFPVKSGTAEELSPTSDAQLATKYYVDKYGGPALLGSTNTWTAQQTFTRLLTVSGTNFNVLNGNVGIGTVSPTSKFDVVDGSITIRGTNAGLRVASFGSGFVKSDASGNLSVGSIGSGELPSNIVYTDTNQTIAGVKTFTSSVTITASGFSVGTSTLVVVSGNVGIGTTGPGAKLDVRSGTSGTGSYALRISTSTDGAGTSVMVFRNDGNVGIGTVAPSGKLEVAGDGNVIFNTSGNVGIGTTSPTERLHVVGNEVISGYSNVGSLRVGGTEVITSGRVLQNVSLASTVIASSVAVNAVGSAQIVDGTIVDADISSSAGISISKLATTGVLGANVVVSSIAVGAVHADAIRDNAVTTAKILDGTITNSDLASGTFSNITGVGTLGSLTVSGGANLATTSGNVGIGTAAPASRLSVSGGVSVGSGYAGTAAPTDGMIIQGNVGIGTTSPAERIDVVGNERVSGYSNVGSLRVGGTEVITSGRVLQNVTLASTVIASSVAVNAVHTDAIQSGAVTDAKIASGISPSKLAAGSLPGNVIASSVAVNAVHTDAIQSGAVTDAKIASGISPSKLAAGSLPGNVIASSVAVNAVHTDAIRDSAVTSAKIADGTIVNADIGNVDASKVTSGNLAVGRMPTGGDWVISSNLSILGSTFVVTTTGNVGIGTTGPASRLSVSGGASIGSGYAGTAAPTDGMIIQGNVGIGTTTPGAMLTVGT